MARISLYKPHDLGREEACAAVRDAAAELAREYDARLEWRSDTLHVRRRGLEGTLEVTERAVDVHVRLGLSMRPFRATLQRELNRLLDACLRTRRGG